MKMESFPQKPPATWPGFYDLMQNDSFADKFVDEVNNHAKRNEKTNIFMKENINSLASVYGVKLHEIEIPTLANGNEWILVKVGRTEKPTNIGNNRMEQVMSEICVKSSVLFSLPKGFCETNSNNDEEKRVRVHMGFSVNKELINKMNLPYSTEWILTTQTDINILLKKIKEKDIAKEWATTQIFNDVLKADWNYSKENLPDGFMLDKERNEIVLSRSGQFPHWLIKKSEKIETEKKKRSRRSIDPDVSGDTSNKPHKQTPGQKKNLQTETDSTVWEGASKYPPSPKEAVTGDSKYPSSPKEAVIGENKYPSSPKEAVTGENKYPSSPKEAVTGSSPKLTGKETASPEGTYTESDVTGIVEKVTSTPAVFSKEMTSREKMKLAEISCKNINKYGVPECIKCGEIGHLVQECPSGVAGGSGYRFREGACYNCCKSGHKSRYCPERNCFNCEESGHLSRDCKSRRSRQGGGSDNVKCYKCGEMGHFARNCFRGRGGDVRNADVKCYRCNLYGHFARECDLKNNNT